MLIINFWLKSSKFLQQTAQVNTDIQRPDKLNDGQFAFQSSSYGIDNTESYSK